MIRKLVTYRTIDEINEHPNADALELARVDGWQCVVKKGEFQPGDSCIYFEIDSWLPADDDRFEFLRKSGVKKDPSGRERIRIRTMKLRKELSQGLALPWSMFPELAEESGAVDAVIEYHRMYRRSIAIQGECMGPGIQGNREKLNGFNLYVFNIYDLDDQKYLEWQGTHQLCLDFNIQHVPVLSKSPMQPFKVFSSVDDILEWSDGPSINNPIREGVVWKGTNGVSFKSISNKFLLKEEE